jgi:uncharacterized repeat protein (TIGR01451 family)
MKDRKMKYLLSFLMLLAPSAVLAESQVSLESQVFVERVAQDAQGKPKTTLEAPNIVTPGDRLLFVLSYKNQGAQPAADFIVTNPLPDAVSYSGTEGEGALVSVDGGKSWGALAALQVAQPDGKKRAALPADVTHIRWRFAAAIPAGKGGKLSFRGVVK